MSNQYTRLGPGIYRISTIQDPVSDVTFNIYTQSSGIDTSYYLTFVGTNTTIPSKNKVYTSSGLSFNPNKNIISYATSSLTFNNSLTNQSIVGFGTSDVTFSNSVVINKNLVVLGNFQLPPNIAVSNISAGSTGDILYQYAPGITSFISPGLVDYVLTSNGPGLPPSFKVSTGGGGSYVPNAGIASYANVAGLATVATYANTSGISSYSVVSGVSTYSATSGIASYANISGVSAYSTVSGYSTISGISSYSPISGISTTSVYSLVAGVSTNSNYSNVSGISTTSNYALISGVSTTSNFSIISGYSTTSGVSSYSNNSGISSFANISGISTVSIYSIISGYSTSSGLSTSSNYSILSGVSTYSVISGYSTLSGVSTTSNFSIISGYSTTSGLSSYSSLSGVSTYAIISGYSTSSGIASSLLSGSESVGVTSLLNTLNINLQTVVSIGGTTGQVISAVDPNSTRLAYWNNNSKAWTFLQPGGAFSFISDVLHVTEPFIIPLSGESQSLTTSVLLTVPYWPASEVWPTIPVWMVNTSPTGSAAQFDIRISGTSIFSTLPTIAAGGSNSTTTTPATYSATFISNGNVVGIGSSVSFVCTQIGASVAGAGLKVSGVCRRALT